MTVKLYRVAPVPEPEFLIVATDTNEAARLFAAAAGLEHSGKQLIIEEFADKLRQTSAANLDAALAEGVSGVLHWTDGTGWFVVSIA